MTEFLQIWYIYSLGLKDELIRFCWPKVKGQGHCELTKHISGMASNNPWTFGTNIHLDWRINSLDFGSQRSMWPNKVFVFLEHDIFRLA